MTGQCLAWKGDPELRLMYGYPVKYWLHKKRYWEYRRAIWASLEADLMANSMTDTAMIEGREEELEEIRRRKMRRRRRRHRRQAIPRTRIRRRIKQKRTASTDSDDPEGVSKGHGRHLWHRGASKITEIRENFKKKFPSIIFSNKRKDSDPPTDLKVEENSKNSEPKKIEMQTTSAAVAGEELETKVKEVKPNPKIEKTVNEVARERKRQRTTYLGHTQPYDWSLLYEHVQETPSLDSNI